MARSESDLDCRYLLEWDGRDNLKAMALIVSASTPAEIGHIVSPFDCKERGR